MYPKTTALRDLLENVDHIKKETILDFLFHEFILSLPKEPALGPLVGEARMLKALDAEKIVAFYSDKVRVSKNLFFKNSLQLAKVLVLSGDYTKALNLCEDLLATSVCFFPQGLRLDAWRTAIIAILLFTLEHCPRLGNASFLELTALSNLLAEGIYSEYLFAKQQIGSPLELSRPELLAKAADILNKETSITSKNLELYRYIFSTPAT